MIAKRIMDIVLSALALILVSPILLLIALAIRMCLGAPVLFPQRRSGLRGRPFTLLKFRTMTGARDSHGSLLPDGQRLTRLGRLLRSCSVDELPQLLNVLTGEMSLVGPRPLPTKYLDRYNPRQMRRHDIKPGITGWAQVNGRNALSWEDKLNLDLWYLEHWSLWLDLRILALTVGRVLGREGISQAGQATTTEFRGSNSA